MTGGAITLDASSTSDATVDEIGVDVGGVVVSVVRPHSEVAGATRAFVGGQYKVNAAGVQADATSTNSATSDAVSIDVDRHRGRSSGGTHRDRSHDRGVRGPAGGVRDLRRARWA